MCFFQFGNFSHRSESNNGVKLFGSLPPTLPQLTDMQHFLIKGSKVIGTFPQELFLSPKMEKIDLSETGLYVNFPPLITAPLSDLYASHSTHRSSTHRKFTFNL
jgi:hypothetical protein